MAVHASEPLVGPSARRNWPEIIRFAPLTSSPHTALVVTRQGRLVSVIPPSMRRTLSDYLDWPFEYREVDMRERILEQDLLLASRDIGYSFLAVLRLIYQVARPERVALEHVDVLHELGEAVSQRAHAIARTLGIEQGGVLKEYLIEALTSGNELPLRFEQLGLSLNRVDVAIELDRRARERAAAVQEQFRDRPLVLHFQLETSDPGELFDTQLGGFYRMRSRDGAAFNAETAEEEIRQAVHHMLRRIAAEFSPDQHQEAAAAMTDEIWRNSILKATLAASNLELLRPAIQIQTGARALPAPQARALLTDSVAPEADVISSSEPALDDRSSATNSNSEVRETSPDAMAAPHADIIDEDEQIDWDRLGAGLSFSTAKGAAYVEPGSGYIDDDDDNPPPPSWMMPVPDEYAPQRPKEPAENAPPPADPGVAAAPEWVERRDASIRDQPDAPSAEPLHEWHGSDRAAEAARPVQLMPAHEVVARWIEALRTHDSQSFRFWARMMIANPANTSEIIAGLTTDAELRDRTEDPRCQALLVETLQAVLGMEDGDRSMPPVAPKKSAPSDETSLARQDTDEPDWMALRRSLGNTDPQG